MARGYVAPPAELVEGKLSAAGFTRGEVGGEIVYSLAHTLKDATGARCPTGFVVQVYTSLAVNGTGARACGKDAIRASLVWTGAGAGARGAGVSKSTPVHRTGTPEGIVERMLERARDMFALANVTARGRKCPKCGAACYADSGKCVVYQCRKGA